MSKDDSTIADAEWTVVDGPGVKVNGPPRPVVVVETSPAPVELPPQVAHVVEVARVVGGHVRAAHSFLADLGLVDPLPAPRSARRKLPRARRER